MADPLNATNTTSAVTSAAGDIHFSVSSLLSNSSSTFLNSLPSKPVLFFILLVVTGFILSYIFVYACKHVVRVFTRKTDTDLDDMLLERLQHPVAWFLFVLCLSVALEPLALASSVASVLKKALLSVNILLIGTIANRVISTLVLFYGGKVTSNTESKLDDHVLPLLKKLITAIVYIITSLFVLSVWGIQIAPLLAGAGIAGIALAFAMQESLKNIFGGVSLAFDGAYAVGDRVKLEDGTAGTVVDISLRSTKIKTFTGDLIVVPNGKIANENFQTYAQPTQQTRVIIPVGVVYGTDVDKVRSVVLDSLQGIENVLLLPEEDKVTKVEFIEMGTYSLNFRASFWVDDYHISWDRKVEATEKIYKALGKHKIDLAFPTQTLIMQDKK